MMAVRSRAATKPRPWVSRWVPHGWGYGTWKRRKDAYLRDVMARLPMQPATQIGELLPYRWQSA